MSFTLINVQDTNKAFITANGSYRLALGHPSNSLSVLWATEDVAPQGVLTFSLDGDPGEGDAVIDLGQTGQSGSRTKVMNMSVWMIDVEVSGLPANGCFVLMCGG